VGTGGENYFHEKICFGRRGVGTGRENLAHGTLGVGEGGWNCENVEGRKTRVEKTKSGRGPMPWGPPPLRHGRRSLLRIQVGQKAGGGRGGGARPVDRREEVFSKQSGVLAKSGVFSGGEKAAKTAKGQSKGKAEKNAGSKKQGCSWEKLHFGVGFVGEIRKNKTMGKPPDQPKGGAHNLFFQRGGGGGGSLGMGRKHFGPRLFDPLETGGAPAPAKPAGFSRAGGAERKRRWGGLGPFPFFYCPFTMLLDWPLRKNSRRGKKKIR